MMGSGNPVTVITTLSSLAKILHWIIHCFLLSSAGDSEGMRIAPPATKPESGDLPVVIDS
jgi:hypothetical protein